MFRYFTTGLAVVALLGSVVIASAAKPRTIQNESGTFVQDRTGAWQEYAPVPQAPRGVVVQEPALDHAKGSIF